MVFDINGFDLLQLHIFQPFDVSYLPVDFYGGERIAILPQVKPLGIICTQLRRIRPNNCLIVLINPLVIFALQIPLLVKRVINEVIIWNNVLVPYTLVVTRQYIVR